MSFLNDELTSEKRGLLIFVEPTPYILDLMRVIRGQVSYPIEVLFAAENVSQSWDLDSEGAPISVLPAAPLRAVLEINSKLASGRYRFAHVAGWGHKVLLASILLAWRHRVPTFVESDTPLRPDLPCWKKIVKRAVYPWLFRIPQKVFPSGSRQAKYFNHYGVPPEKIVVVKMTVDVASIMKWSLSPAAREARHSVRAQWGMAPDEMVFIFVGRLEPQKGLKMLIKVFDDICACGTGARLIIAGDGSLRSFVELQAAAIPQLRYLGRLKPGGVLSAYNAADVAVLPSLFEPWGLVVNEAMAAGLPVIASSAVGCTDDLVRDGETGSIFPAYSAEALRTCMRFFVDHPQERKKMGCAARALISGWTLEKEAEILMRNWECALQ